MRWAHEHQWIHLSEITAVGCLVARVHPTCDTSFVKKIKQNKISFSEESNHPKFDKIYTKKTLIFVMSNKYHWIDHQIYFYNKYIFIINIEDTYIDTIFINPVKFMIV